jgi:type I restriction enzyme R subunit
MSAFTESSVDSAALAWLAALGHAMLHGQNIAAGEPAAERSNPDCRFIMLESSGS